MALIAKGYTLGGGSVSGAVAVALAQAVPVAFVAPLSGRLADLGRGKQLAILADLGRVLTLVAIAFADSKVLVLAAAAITSLLAAVFRPAEARWESWLLKTNDELLTGGSARAAVQSTFKVLGPALAGLAVGFYGVRVALILDATSFAASAMLLAWVPSSTHRSQPDESGLLGGLSQTVVRISRNFELRALFFIFGVVVLITSMQSPLFYVFFVDGQSGPKQFGIAMAFLGGGSLIGSALINRRPGMVRDGPRALVAVLIIDSVALGVLAVSGMFWLACVAMVFMGLIGSVFGVVIRYTIQTGPARESAGSVFGLIEAVEGPLATISLLILLVFLESVPVVHILLGSALVEFAFGVSMIVALLLRIRTNARSCTK